MASLKEVLPARDRLLNAATRLFIEHGYAGTPVSRIVREAGVTMPVLYYHFGNKADLLRAVVSVRGQWFRVDLPADASADFEGNCRALVDHALQNLDLVRDGLRLRLLLGFETGPEVDVLRNLVEEQRARSIARIAETFAAILPDATPRRANWLAEIYLSGAQSLALELIGMIETNRHLPEKAENIVRLLTIAAALPEEELPGLQE